MERRDLEVELVEVYKYEGIPEKRFRFRIKGTRIYINVSAEDVEEASEKVKNIIRSLELYRYLEKVSEGGIKEA